MTVPRTDSRFLLPQPVQRVSVSDGVSGWRDGLREAGLEVVPGRNEVDLSVMRAERLERPVVEASQAIIAEGRDARRRLRRLGLACESYLPLPDLERPAVLIPVGRPSPARYALERWLLPESSLKRFRNLAVGALLARGVAAPVREFVTIGARLPGRPWLVAAAEQLGIPAEVEWLFTPGETDVLSRGALHLFVRGEALPRWALKFSRVPGYDDAFERDQRGMAVVAAGGAVLADHAPRPVGRFVANGLHASVETAAAGQRLIGFLHSELPRMRKHAIVEEIAAWLLEVTTRTRASPAKLQPELERLERDVLPAWTAAGAPPRLAASLTSIPAVAQHNDLGTWNVVVGERGFIALDWESARRFGFPLWDLWYFLRDATAHLDGAATHDERERHFVSLFKGELPASSVLFRWTRTLVDACDLPPDTIGSIATLCWLHHGLSAARRRRDLSGRAPRGASSEFPTVYARLARRWLADPELGPGWDRWQHRAPERRAPSGDR